MGHLDYYIHTGDLFDYFSRFGELEYCEVKFEKETGIQRGFGFVTFESKDACKKVSV